MAVKKYFRLVSGERCLVQNVVTKLWDREAIITGLRTAADNTIVSYNIDIAGVKSTRHRTFLRKLIVNDNNEDLPKVDDTAAGKFLAAEQEVLVTGQAGDSAVQRPLRRSARIHSKAGAGNN